MTESEDKLDLVMADSDVFVFNFSGEWPDRKNTTMWVDDD